MTFQELGLRQEILDAVAELGFVNPMPVQEQVIPYMLTHENDLVALAQTGTGKTAAFGLPILNMVNVEQRKIQSLVLAPTRLGILSTANCQRVFLFPKGDRSVPLSLPHHLPYILPLPQ